MHLEIRGGAGNKGTDTVFDDKGVSAILGALYKLL